MTTTATRPERIALRNFLERLPEGAVRVTRPSRWGNPFRVEQHGLLDAIRLHRQWLLTGTEPIRLGRHIYDPTRVRNELHLLRGKPLACTCPAGQPCHADTLLELANR
ncbi:MAG: DUF4326 domain-containing protein [Synechococcaceae cyanobacterium]|nr:DUF4326 domain-containing protein [Synechococcaceae cyanobacterium]